MRSHSMAIGIISGGIFTRLRAPLFFVSIVGRPALAVWLNFLQQGLIAFRFGHKSLYLDSLIFSRGYFSVSFSLLLFILILIPNPALLLDL